MPLFDTASLSNEACSIHCSTSKTKKEHDQAENDMPIGQMCHVTLIMPG